MSEEYSIQTKPKKALMRYHYCLVITFRLSCLQESNSNIKNASFVLQYIILFAVIFTSLKNVGYYLRVKCLKNESFLLCASNFLCFFVKPDTLFYCGSQKKKKIHFSNFPNHSIVKKMKHLKFETLTRYDRARSTRAFEE